jgi:hypothetical protein
MPFAIGAIYDFVPILAPDNTHLACDLKIELGVGLRILKVTFGYRNGSLHSTPSWGHDFQNILTFCFPCHDVQKFVYGISSVFGLATFSQP